MANCENAWFPASPPERRCALGAQPGHPRQTHASYGWLRTWRALLARGIFVGKRVQKLMQLHGLCAKCKQCFKVTTDSRHDLPISPDLLNRERTVAKRHPLWASDSPATSHATLNLTDCWVLHHQAADSYLFNSLSRPLQEGWGHFSSLKPADSIRA